MAAEPTVLIVDDDDQIRILLRALLEDAGFTIVGEAADGAQAVTLAAELRPSLVTMDLQMPTMSGAEAARAIISSGHAQAVVIVSGSHSNDLLAEALSCGAFAHVRKADAPMQLPDILRYALAAPPAEGIRQPDAS